MKRSNTEKIVLVIVCIIFALYGISIIYPFVVTFFNSLKTPAEFLGDKIGLSKHWLFSNYKSAFKLLEYKGTNLFGMLVNSIVFVFLATAFNTLSCLVSSYAISKYKRKFGSFLYALAVAIMVIPIVGSTGMSLDLIKFLGIYDNLLGVAMLYSGGFGVSFFILYSAFKSVSWEYAEAGFIDGAGHFRVFWNIMLPQISGTIFAVAIFQIVGIWNDYYTSYLYMPNVPTIAVGLYFLEPIVRQNGQNLPVYFAAMLISTLPVLVIFISFQKLFIQNMSIGGIKG